MFETPDRAVGGQPREVLARGGPEGPVARQPIDEVGELGRSHGSDTRGRILHPATTTEPQPSAAPVAPVPRGAIRDGISEGYSAARRNRRADQAPTLTRDPVDRPSGVGGSPSPGRRAGQGVQRHSAQDCVKTKSLGEDSSGCACFVCNPDGPNRKVVCTTDEVVKKKLRALSNPS